MISTILLTACVGLLLCALQENMRNEELEEENRRMRRKLRKEEKA